MLKREHFLVALFFVLIKLFTWGFGYYLASVTPIDSQYYFSSFNHFKVDNRATNGEISFFKLWNYADSEWYLSIAQDGYPSKNQILSHFQLDSTFKSTVKVSYGRYAFFPLYPLIIRIFTPIFSLEAAAFIATLLINVLAVIAFLYLIEQYFHGEDPIWPFLLLFLYPFSIFYSLYFTEALFLLLSLLVFIFMKTRKYVLMAVFGLLLTLSRPNGIFIIFPILLYFFIGKEKKALPYVSVSVIPVGLLLYIAFCYFQTGIWNFYSYAVSDYDIGFSLGHLLNQIMLILDFFRLPVHTYQQSKIETLVMLFFGVVLVFMWRSKFPRELTLWSTLLWAIPLMAKPDLTSYSRYMSVSFPVFLFMAFTSTNKKMNYVLLILLAIGYYWALKVVIKYDWLG